jgi:hypothetical protein
MMGNRLLWKSAVGFVAPTVAVLAMFGTPAEAKNSCSAIGPAGNCNNGGQQQDFNSGNRRNLGVPGPVAGASLPLLIIAGGYGFVWLRRTRGERTLPDPSSSD